MPSIPNLTFRTAPHALLALLALTLLAACAPSAGRGGGQPVKAGADPIPAHPGETLTVRVDYDFSDFSLTPGDLSPTLWIPSGFASEAGDVTGTFALRDVRLAEEWSVSLVRMRVERKEETNLSGTSKTTVHSLWAEVRVSVPENAISGTYRIRGNLVPRTGRPAQLQFRLDVRP